MSAFPLFASPDQIFILIYNQSTHGPASQWSPRPSSWSILAILVEVGHVSQLVIVALSNGRFSFVLFGVVIPRMHSASAS